MTTFVLTLTNPSCPIATRDLSILFLQHVKDKADRPEADELAGIGGDDARKVIVIRIAQSSASAPPRTPGPSGRP
jgi:hypothetical protein